MLDITIIHKTNSQGRALVAEEATMRKNTSLVDLKMLGVQSSAWVIRLNQEPKAN